jgi:hypothetical protein
MYVNGKIRAAENILGIRGINENDGRENSSMIYMIF